MKKVGFLLLLSGVILVSSCKKKKEDPTTPPSITLNGSSNMVLELGDPYNDMAALAKDVNRESVKVKVSSNNVDTTRAGSYQVVYSATDCFGNTAQKSRSVKVEITKNTWSGGWNVNHDVKTSLGQNLIKNTCDVSSFLNITTFDHDGQVVTGEVNGDSVTIDTSRISINFGSGTYDLFGEGYIYPTGDTIVIYYQWNGVCGLCFDGNGTATYTKQ